MKSINYQLLIAICTLGVSFSAPAAEGGNQGSQSYPPQQRGNAEAPEVSDAEVAKFKEAFTEIRAIRKEYSSQLENADSADTAKQLQQKAQVDMINAVEEAGLSVEQYNRITTAIQENPELQARVFDKN